MAKKEPQIIKFKDKDLLEQDVGSDSMERVSLLNAVENFPKEGLYLAIELRIKLEEVYEEGTHEQLKQVLREVEAVLKDWGVPIDYSLDWIYAKKQLH